MASSVGSSAALSTWGKFRCTWCLQLNYDITSATDFDITYGSGQKASADGSGLIRWKPRPIVPPYFTSDVQPSIFNQAYLISFPPAFGGNRIFTDTLQASATSPTGVESSAVTVESRAELTGELVGFFDGRNTALNATFWDEGRYTWDGPTLGPTSAGDVVSIGKLTAF